MTALSKSSVQGPRVFGGPYCAMAAAKKAAEKKAAAKKAAEKKAAAKKAASKSSSQASRLLRLLGCSVEVVVVGPLVPLRPSDS